MKFRQLEETKTPVSPAGNRIQKKYEMRMMKNGHKYLAETGEIDIYERIQERKDECDAKKIIQRARMGDPNAIAKIQNARTNYGDTTLMPKNLMEAQQKIIDGKKAFYELPKEIREKFNNDPMQFMADEQKVNEVTTEYLKAKGVIKEVKAPETTQTTTEDGGKL